MSELRKDAIVGRWVIIAENRAARPSDLVDHATFAPTSTACPFCEGSESQTPGEIEACRTAGTGPDQPGWRVRVVPNKFPALFLDGRPEVNTNGIYERMDGLGAHEVIIESPRHIKSLTELKPRQVEEVIDTYRARMLDLKRDKRLVYGMIFKNVGAPAGASLEHAHSQLIATPIVPISVAEELSGSEQIYRSRGRCPYCEMVELELAEKSRLVDASPGFVAFCPYASRFPFETWIVPREHASHFETLRSEQTLEFASLLLTVLQKIERALALPAYNYLVHTAPFDTVGLNHYHWHMEIIPRVTKTAGFEWGSGFYINPVSPEQAARLLRALSTVVADGQGNPTGSTG